jgi:PAS domain-containing protein
LFYAKIILKLEIPLYSPSYNTDRRTDVAAGRSVGSVCLAETDFVMAVFKNLAVGVIVCDTKGHFVFVSPEAERILGIGAMHAELVA